MVNFGLLAAEIGPVVWGIPANFNGFCILATLLRGTLVVGVSQIAALNRGRHLYSAGWPSHWALAHLPSYCCSSCSCSGSSNSSAFFLFIKCIYKAHFRGCHKCAKNAFGVVNNLCCSYCTACDVRRMTVAAMLRPLALSVDPAFQTFPVPRT